MSIHSSLWPFSRTFRCMWIFGMWYLVFFYEQELIGNQQSIAIVIRGNFKQLSTNKALFHCCLVNMFFRCISENGDKRELSWAPKSCLIRNGIIWTKNKNLSTIECPSNWCLKMQGNFETILHLARLWQDLRYHRWLSTSVLISVFTMGAYPSLNLFGILVQFS